jgi:hypothetical protein
MDIHPILVVEMKELALMLILLVQFSKEHEGKCMVSSSRNDEENVSLTKEHYKSLVALLEKCNV